MRMPSRHAWPLRSLSCQLLTGSMCTCQVIKRFIMHAKKTAFIVEHDFIMAAYLADRVIVYEGEPSKAATARAPQSLLSGKPLLPPVCVRRSLPAESVGTTVDVQPHSAG